MMKPIQLFTFKWGDKYSHKYVNRLYGGLKCNVNVPFELTCITDDTTGIRPEVNIINYDDLKKFPNQNVFSVEKLSLFDHSQTAEHSAWIDLDVLIHGDITEYLTRDLDKPTFIFNHWSDLQTRSMRYFGKGSSCHINSSFVCWNYDRGKWLYDYTLKEYEKISFTYNSMDKYLFYRHWVHDDLGLWEDGIVYNYNYPTPKEEPLEGYKIALFNTSHIKNNNGMKNDAVELHDAGGWVKELWESYDKI